MSFYNQQISLPFWKPIYFDNFIGEIHQEFGTSRPIKILKDNYLQYVFYDASLLNSDELIIVISFIKNEDSADMSFIAGNEITKWFDWDLTTETKIIKKYKDKMSSLIVR
jgi:hypothetical protein